jgi:RNA polymerase sigma-70 factor (ECF subfamily)
VKKIRRQEAYCRRTRRSEPATVPQHARTVPSPGVGPALDIQQLYEEHADFIHLMLARLLGPDGADPADLLQETFIIAMRKLPKARVESPRAWLCDIAVKLALVSRRNARLRRLLGMQVPRTAETRRTPEDIAENREEIEALYAALDKLSDIKRTVLILFEIQGFSGDEIAATLRIPKKTVYTRLFHARRELSRLFTAAQQTRCRVRGSGRD